MSKFEQLPNEMLLKIFCDPSIPTKTLYSLSCVCKRFQDVCCSEKKLWKSQIEQRWPLVMKVINSGNENSSQSIILIKDVECVIKISKRFKEIFNSISYQSYNFENIPQQILSSISELLNVEKFGLSVVVSELRNIIKDERDTNLTKVYYAKKVLYHVNYSLVSEKLKEFFKLPPERQNLEKGFCYLAKGLFPADFFDIEYKEVSSNLDRLSYEVQSYLKTKHPCHPAASIKLFSPDEPLEKTQWSFEECFELFESIKHIVFMEQSYEKYKIIFDIFSNKILRRKLESSYRILIIFIAVSHRLGTLLNPIDVSEMFLLKLNFSSAENIKAIHAIYNGNWVVLDEETPIHICTTKELLICLAMKTFYETEEENISYFGIDQKVAAAGMTLQVHSLPEDDIGFVNNTKTLEYCLNREIHLEAIIDTCKKLFKINSLSNKTLKKIRNFFNRTKHLLTTQRKGPKPIKQKKRMNGIDVKFAIGMIVQRKQKSESGVIIGWDEHKLESRYDDIFETKISPIKDKELQPFYRVLLSDGSIYYEAQENLLLTTKLVPVKHYKVGKYFRNFNGKFYVPNEELRFEYPDDEKVINELIENKDLIFNTKSYKN